MRMSLIFFGLLLTALALFLNACKQTKTLTPASLLQAEPVAYEGTIVAMGNSLTEGFGLSEAEAYPAQLERKLQAEGHRYQVINAGVSGETSSGALSRVEWILTLEPDIVILETGGNDGLRAIDPELTEKNIDQIITRINEEGSVVVLAGMQTIQNLGESYATAFEAIYPTLAERHNLILIPFFLEGVAADPKLNQADGIHPTAAGYEVVLETIYPYVLEAIEGLGE